MKFRRFWAGKRISSAIEIREKDRFNNVALCLLAGLIFISSLVFFERKGQREAGEIVEEHAAGESSSGSMIKVVINDEEKIIRHLGCGAKNCAGIEVGSNIIYYYPQEHGYSFTHQGKK